MERICCFLISSRMQNWCNETLNESSVCLYAFCWMQLHLIATHWISVHYARGKAISIYHLLQKLYLSLSVLSTHFEYLHFQQHHHNHQHFTSLRLPFAALEKFSKKLFSIICFENINIIKGPTFNTYVTWTVFDDSSSFLAMHFANGSYVV